MADWLAHKLVARPSLVDFTGAPGWRRPRHGGSGPASRDSKKGPLGHGPARYP